jgi:antitoxin component of MazEF toxin-antitoxin module
MQRINVTVGRIEAQTLCVLPVKVMKYLDVETGDQITFDPAFPRRIIIYRADTRKSQEKE